MFHPPLLRMEQMTDGLCEWAARALTPTTAEPSETSVDGGPAVLVPAEAAARLGCTQRSLPLPLRPVPLFASTLTGARC